MPRRKKEDEIALADRKGPPRGAANARERTRMRVLSKAFGRLKLTLPWVPPDTKLSKLDTLRLATSYISHLQRVLDDEDGDGKQDICTQSPVSEMDLRCWPYGQQRLAHTPSSLNQDKDQIKLIATTDQIKLIPLADQIKDRDNRWKPVRPSQQQQQHDHNHHQQQHQFGFDSYFEFGPNSVESHYVVGSIHHGSSDCKDLTEAYLTHDYVE